MKEKKQPQRMCVACKQMKNKKDLIRIVKTQNEIVLDSTGRENGRGAYICNSLECFNKSIKQKSLNRAFKENIPNEVLEKLKEAFIESK